MQFKLFKALCIISIAFSDSLYEVVSLFYLFLRLFFLRLVNEGAVGKIMKNR